MVIEAPAGTADVSPNDMNQRYAMDMRDFTPNFNTDAGKGAETLHPATRIKGKIDSCRILHRNAFEPPTAFCFYWSARLFQSKGDVEAAIRHARRPSRCIRSIRAWPRRRK